MVWTFLLSKKLWGAAIVVLLISIIAAIIGFMPASCSTPNARINETINQSSENVTEDTSITGINDRNVSCTAFAAWLSKQQLAKQSDQNLAEATVSVCNTQFINADCKNWNEYGFSNADKCREYYQVRK